MNSNGKQESNGPAAAVANIMNLTRQLSQRAMEALTDAPAQCDSPTSAVLSSRFEGQSSAQRMAQRRLDKSPRRQPIAAPAAVHLPIAGVRMDETKGSTRAGFLRTLAEIVGVRPPNDSTGRLPWRDEYEPLAVAWMESQRAQQREPQHFAGTKHSDLVRFLRTEEGGNYMLVNDIDMPQAVQREQAKVDLLVGSGWHPEHAEAFQLLFPLRSELSADLERDGQHGVRFPACNYAIAEALYHTAAANAIFGEEAPRRLYKHLTGPNSLTEADAAWGGLKVPDRTGFRGLTSTALCVATDDPRSFTSHGFRNKVAKDDGDGASYDLVATDMADVVCFEGGCNEEEMMHSCVMIDEHHGALPANTLFRLKRVEEAGTWAVAGMAEGQVGAAAAAAKSRQKPKITRRQGTFTPDDLRLKSAAAEAALAPASVYPNCRLFVVSCTFKRPTERPNGAGGASGAKLCASVRTLLYSSRETYVNGLDDILEGPVLTMEEEFNRIGQKPYVDWRGVTHALSSLWAYATGTACALISPDDTRDEHNDGMRPADFMARANAHITSKRAEFVARHVGGPRDGHASTDGFDPALLLLNEADALLTLDEVLAVRLYSGPAFQPINAFLREIGKLSGDFRIAMARHRELTFAATTRHLCRAIRKLADVTRDEANTRLYRAVRGELPPAFWDKDSLGMISAVDSGFTSTSKNMRTPVAYMDGAFNVLWELAAGEPSDDAYHRGADISMLSQYAHEDEVLFPPNTMLIVQPASDALSNGGGGVPAEPDAASSGLPALQKQRSMHKAALSKDESDAASGKAWKLIRVRPCFV